MQFVLTMKYSLRCKHYEHGVSDGPWDKGLTPSYCNLPGSDRGDINLSGLGLGNTSIKFTFLCVPGPLSLLHGVGPTFSERKGSFYWIS